MGTSAVGVEQWDRVLTNIKEEIGEDKYFTWFQRVKLEKMADSKVILSVPTRFIRKYLESNYEGHIFDLWKRECEWIKSIEFTVRGMSKPVSSNVVGTGVKSSVPALGTRYKDATKNLNKLLESRPVDDKFTFDVFAVGPSNRMAYAAAKEVTEQILADRPVRYNPLFIASEVGLGKTHLLNSIANQLKVENRKVSNCTAEFFMHQFVSALQNQSATDFKDALRKTDILLIDDMQFLNGKKVQEEFCHTLNEFIDSNKQVVCAADKIPSEIKLFNERMNSRLKGGIVTEITAPDLELRKEMIRIRCDAERAETPDFELSEPIITYIAENLTTNGRELVGAVQRLSFTYRFTHQPITLEIAEESVKDLIKSAEPYTLRIESIFEKVSAEFNVDVDVLLSNQRSRSVVIPRQIAMYLAKKMTSRSLPEIGKKFGGRDHTTVLYAFRKVNSKMLADSDFAKRVEKLEYSLRN